jgi:hypothetical protein
VRCPSCGFDNPEGLKFCGECGTPVTAPCPTCGFANPLQFKFCGDCGASLTPTSRTARIRSLTAHPHPPSRYTPAYLAEKILTSKAALEGECKQVTVLFADLKGSMELLADRDPEDARQLLDPVLEHRMAAMHRSEGNTHLLTGGAPRGVATPGAVPALRESSTALGVPAADRGPPSHCPEMVPGT